MKFIILTFLVFCGFNSFAQDYATSIQTFRKQQQEALTKTPRGPLRDGQTTQLKYYEPNISYKVEATLDPLFGEKAFQMPTFDGSSNSYIRYAILTFPISGVKQKLIAYQSATLLKDPKYTNYLFVPFKDETNGTASYEGGRYLELDASAIKNGKVIVDFNKAYNPYCAYSNGYRCPIPPHENHLEIPIFAGEQKYKGNKNDRIVDINSASFFEKNEKSIILSGDVNSKLHVYQTTNNKELEVLKNSSQDINFKDPLIVQLKNRMLETVQDPEHAGVGIAAPQIGINRNLIWVQRFDKTDKPFEFYINPKIIWRSKLYRKGTEGCLSIPDRKEEIERSYAIRIQYLTEEGLVTEENIEGFTAVIFQHEIDHLYGILYPDRLEEQANKELIPLNEKIPFTIEKGNVLP